MKNTSNTMYNIGRIFTIVEIVLGPIFFLLGLIFAIVGGIVDEAAALVGYGSTLIGYGIWFIVGGILCLIFVGKAKRELQDESNKNPTPFILTIVFGAIAGNVFYVLAGIFGLIADSQQGGNAEPKQVEEKPEEPKAEQFFRKQNITISPQRAFCFVLIYKNKS